MPLPGVHVAAIPFVGEPRRRERRREFVVARGVRHKGRDQAGSGRCVGARPIGYPDLRAIRLDSESRLNYTVFIFYSVHSLYHWGI